MWSFQPQPRYLVCYAPTRLISCSDSETRGRARAPYPPLLRGRLRCCRSHETKNKIGRRRGADVFQTMKIVRSIEEHRAWARALGFSIDEHLDRSGFHDDHFFVRMAVRRVRRLTAIHRRHVTLQI